MSFFGAGKQMIQNAIGKLGKKDQPQTLAPAPRPAQAKKKGRARQPRAHYHGHPIEKLSPRIQRVLAEKERRRQS